MRPSGRRAGNHPKELSMLDFLKKIMGGGNDAQLKKLRKPVDEVMALEDEYRKLTDEQLQAKTAEFRARLQNGETEDDFKEAFLCLLHFGLVVTSSKYNAPCPNDTNRAGDYDASGKNIYD